MRVIIFILCLLSLPQFFVHAQTKKSFTYGDPDRGFSVVFPGEPEDLPSVANQLKEKKTEGWETIARTFVDEENEVVYMLFCKEAEEGYFIEDENVMLEDVKTTAESQGKYKNITADTGRYQSMRAIWMKAEGVDGYVFMRTMAVVRDNRFIMLLVLGEQDKLKDSLVNAYFNSLRFLRYKEETWTEQTIEKLGARVLAPSPFGLDTTENGNPNIYATYDRYANSTFGVEVYPLSKYYWAENETAVFTDIKNLLLNGTDSLLAERQVRNGNLPGLEFDILVNSSVLWRFRALRNGDTVYILSAKGSPEYLNQATPRYFESFKVERPVSGDHVFQNKTALLLKDLRSEDSVTFDEAYAFLDIAPFTNKDLPLLHQALLQNRKDDLPGYGVLSKLAYRISDLLDNSTVSFVEDNLAAIKAQNKLPNILLMLAQLKTQESFTLLKRLLIQKQATVANPYAFRDALQDSSQLTATLFPDILQLADDTVFIHVLPPLINLLIEEGRFDTTWLTRFASGYFKQMDYFLMKSPDEENWEFRSWFLLLERFNDARARALIQKLQSANSQSVKYLAVTSAVNTKQPLQKAAIDKLVKDDYYRMDIYQLLQTNGKIKEFPAAFHSQKSIFQSVLYNYAKEDYQVEKMEFVGEKVRTLKGKQVKFYLFRVHVADAGPALGIIGSELSGQKEIRTEADYLHITEEDFDSSKIDEMLDAYIANLID